MMLKFLQNFLARWGIIQKIADNEANLLKGLLVLASLLLAFGIVTPMMTISKFVVVTNTFSVFSGITELFDKGQYILFIVLSGFSIIIPIIKITILFVLVNQRTAPTNKVKKYLHLMHDYGRWAMLDVLVVAVLIVTVKLGAIASIQVHSGLYIFGAAVLLIMTITHRVVTLLQE